MMALDTPTDREVYHALNCFNALVPVAQYPFFHEPSGPVLPFHEALLAEFGEVLRETILIKGKDMPMCELDNIQREGLGRDQRWRVYWIKAFGMQRDTLCPTITRIVSQHPQIFNVMLSRLEPGMKIRAHQGPFRGVMRYHLGLLVPKGYVGLRVANKTEEQEYRWKPGEGVLFDDTNYHMAWNYSDEDRVVLFADVLRDDLAPEVLAQRDEMLARLSASAGVEGIRESIERNTL
jgi:aspartyl/asparaginyl beta-hydroxylase (cupin superfamily)